MTTAPVIDKEFQSLIPSLSNTELEQLEQNILADGIRDALVIWHGSLLDGHNRLVIAQKHGLAYQTKEVDLPDRNAAMLWVVKNQLGRRNLTPQQMSYLRGTWYEREKKDRYSHPKTVDHFDPRFETSAARIASATGVSAPTVKRDAEYSRAVDRIAEVAGPEAKAAILSAGVRMTKKEVKQAARLVDDMPDLVREICNGSLTISQAKRKHTRAQDERRILALEPVTGKFRTILVDPPWDYGSLSLAGRAAPRYAVMGDEELLALPVPGWADEQCHLYLWTTNNFLGRALALVESWGFAYKTLITWVKPSFGLGSYFRNSTEHCLFAVKGNLTTRVKNIPTHFEAKRQGHSVKPDMIYSIAERASYPPRLEVFTRQERKEWEKAFHE